jgi:hypothetical protein
MWGNWQREDAIKEQYLQMKMQSRITAMHKTWKERR